MITTRVRLSETPSLVVCDGLCGKAFGISRRPCIRDPADVDNIVWLADGEVGDAPADPGTYEGGHGKPFHPDRHNKWCVRECERAAVIGPGQPIRYPDHSCRIYNKPWMHGRDGSPQVETGETFEPPAE